MLRSSNFEIVYVGSKRIAGVSSKPTNSPSVLLGSGSCTSTERTFRSSHSDGSISVHVKQPDTSVMGTRRRKASMVSQEELDDVPFPLDSDIGDLVSDDSDLNALDGSDSNWMHKIDVTDFKDMQMDSTDVSERISRKRALGELDEYDGVLSENVPSTAFAEQRLEIGSKYRPSDGCWTKPSYSYSCLVALALKNSRNGQLTVSEIYDFMCENFPYFRTAPPGWKNSVRHNLSLNKCFQKVELIKPDGQGRKSCLWSLNPSKMGKMDQEVRKWRERDTANIKESLVCPEDLDAIEQGRKGIPVSSKMLCKTEECVANGRPLCPRPSEVESGCMMQSNFVLVTQPPAKQLKSTVSVDLSSSGSQLLQRPSLRMMSPPRRERLRSISVPQGGPLRVPEGSTATEVAAKNLEAALHRSPRVIYSTPAKNLHPVSSAPPASDVTFPSFNQCGSPPFSLQSPKEEKDNWQGVAAASFSPLSGSPISFGSCPYDTVTSALNNNSLLQSALAQSPCRNISLYIAK